MKIQYENRLKFLEKAEELKDKAKPKKKRNKSKKQILSKKSKNKPKSKLTKYDCKEYKTQKTYLKN
jgi:hypothetical protein